MPAPLSSLPGPVNVNVGIDAVARVNAELVTMAMQFIAAWSYVDLELTMLTTRLAHSDFHIVAGMLSALRGSRTDALQAAGAAALRSNPFDLKLFVAVLRKAREVEKRRNRYAHDLWGIIPEKPDVLILVKHNDLARHDAVAAARFAAVSQAVQRLEQSTDVGQAQIRSELDQHRESFIFERSDFEMVKKNRLASDLAMARHAHDLAYILNIALLGGKRGERFRALLSTDLQIAQ